jgi:hypothetical protein
LRDYEKGHANRMVGMAILDHRLDELAGGAAPSDGSPSAHMPEVAQAAADGSQFGPQRPAPRSTRLANHPVRLEALGGAGLEAVAERADPLEA